MISRRILNFSSSLVVISDCSLIPDRPRKDVLIICSSKSVLETGGNKQEVPCDKGQPYL